MTANGVLTGLREGDFFFALAGNGAQAECLVTSADGNNIRATRITTQEALIFDAQTGEEIGGGFQTISTQALPENIKHVLLKLEERYRLSSAPDRWKLRQEEIEALNFVSDTIYLTDR